VLQKVIVRRGDLSTSRLNGKDAQIMLTVTRGRFGKKVTGVFSFQCSVFSLKRIVRSVPVWQNLNTEN
jgi:hypothetical protein